MMDTLLMRRVLAALLGILALAVLTGWAWHIDILKTVLPGLTTMKANTAVGFLLCTLSLMTLGYPQRPIRLAGGGAAIAVALLGLLTLTEYIGHVSVGIDELLVADPATTSAPFNGRMSPATAIGFLAGGASLWLVAFAQGRRSVTSGHALAAIPGLVGLLSLTGYAYNVQALYNFGPFATVALHTGVGMVALAAAVLLTRALDGWFAPYAGRPIATAALMRISILSVLLPFLTGVLVVRGISAGYYQAQVTPALFAVAATVLLIWLALRSAAILAGAEKNVERADAAAQRRAEELELTNSRHTALVENLPQLVWTCLPDGRCDYFSPQWIAYTGLTAREQVGFEWLTRVVHPDDHARTLEHWMGAVAGYHPYDIEYRIRGVDGTYRWFKSRGTPINGVGGHIEYWFGTSTDIQDIVEAREVLALSRADLEQQVEARTSELMVVEAQLRQSQKMEAVGQLTGGIAHDFNNLLTIIRSAADLLRRPNVADDRRRVYLDAIADTADRAAKLTAQLLAFSRRQALKPELFDGAERVDAVADMMRSIVGEGIAVEVVRRSEDCLLNADISQFETALVNMTINARDAMDGAGTITLEVKMVSEIPALRGHPAVPGGFVAISLTDSGVGISEDAVERIFEPFYTTKPLGKGTGLGLSQVFGFAKQSGGDVGVRTSLGRGATFTLYLPHANDGHGSTEKKAPARERNAIHSSGARRILVVEDNVDVGRFSTQILEDLGYVTAWAHDASEALALIEAGEIFDVLFSDVVMPGMNGVELGRAVQKRFPTMPIILTSGYSDVLADEGQHEFELLKKPYAVEELSRLLRNTLAT